MLTVVHAHFHHSLPLHLQYKYNRLQKKLCPPHALLGQQRLQQLIPTKPLELLLDLALNVGRGEQLEMEGMRGVVR